ncbi:MEDS domain-containing protein (plasmid) [Embleya sp. NBC_00888]|uniref:MEDS domain-containing protein n=1 Tax=Embleya sp. NBC_00888 TaxID=2975960 RepID=UPI002F914F4F|nr:MEDS domain-containing protein [Embleya sp. NBC_00888]
MTRRTLPVPEYPLVSHDLLLYDTDARFLGSAGPFVEAGLAAGEPVFVVTGQRNADLLRDLFGAGPAGVTYAGAGPVSLPAQALTAYQARARVQGRTRVVGEIRWPAGTRRRIREWARFEALPNVVLVATGARHLCPYDVRTLPLGVLRAELRTRPGLPTAGGGWANPTYVATRDFSAACDGAALPEPPTGHRRFDVRGVREVADLRSFVARHARAGGLDAERVGLLVLCVHETVSVPLLAFGDPGGAEIAATAALALLLAAFDAAGADLKDLEIDLRLDLRTSGILPGLRPSAAGVRTTPRFRRVVFSAYVAASCLTVPGLAQPGAGTMLRAVACAATLLGGWPLLRWTIAPVIASGGRSVLCLGGPFIAYLCAVAASAPRSTMIPAAMGVITGLTALAACPGAVARASGRRTARHATKSRRVWPQ